MATAPTPTPTPLSVLSFGSAPPPAVAQLPAGVSLNLVGAQQPSTATVHPQTPPINLAHVARTVLKAKRVAVVCGQSALSSPFASRGPLTETSTHTGAGISTASGIPDFRSGAGLFESLKKQYPDAKLSSGKDLFDVGLFAVSPFPGESGAHAAPVAARCDQSSSHVD